MPLWGQAVVSGHWTRSHASRYSAPTLCVVHSKFLTNMTVYIYTVCLLVAVLHNLNLFAPFCLAVQAERTLRQHGESCAPLLCLCCSVPCGTSACRMDLLNMTLTSTATVDCMQWTCTHFVVNSLYHPSCVPGVVLLDYSMWALLRTHGTTYVCVHSWGCVHCIASFYSKWAMQCRGSSQGGVVLRFAIEIHRFHLPLTFSHAV